MGSLCSFLLTRVAQAGIDPVITLNTTRRETLKCETVCPLIPSLLLSSFKILNFRGTWVVKHPTLDFGSGPDLRVVR